MESDLICCKNCNHHFEGRFCNFCGQKANTNRLTWKEVFHYIPHAVLHLDEGFFYTTKQLAIRPGYAIREYLNGKRKQHYNPFLMLVLLAGLSSYLYVHFHFQTIIASVRLDKLSVTNAIIADNFFAFRTLFFCLLCSMGDYIFFYEKRYTLPEIVVANVFMFCGVMVFQLIFIPLFFLSRYLEISLYFQTLFLFLVMVYLFIAHYQFYAAKANKWLAIKIGLALLFYLSVVFVIGLKAAKPFFKS